MSEDKQRRWMPALVAAFVLIGVAAWVSVLLPMGDEVPVEPTEEKAAIPARRLGEWKGQLALFEEGTAEPIEVYEVSVLTLPTEEQKRIREGITVENEDILAELLENYTS